MGGGTLIPSDTLAALLEALAALVEDILKVVRALMSLAGA